MYDIEWVPIEKIVCHPSNPNEGDIEEIRNSMRRFGWVGLIVAQRNTGWALVGNNRLVAAALEGHEEVPVLWADLDEEQSVKFMVAHNLTRQKAKLDKSKLVDVLATLEEFSGTGYTFGDYERMLRELQPPAGSGAGGSPPELGDHHNDPSVAVEIGPYSFIVESGPYRLFYQYLMDSANNDMLEAEEIIRESLGFSRS